MTRVHAWFEVCWLNWSLTPRMVCWTVFGPASPSDVCVASQGTPEPGSQAGLNWNPCSVTRWLCSGYLTFLSLLLYVQHGAMMPASWAVLRMGTVSIVCQTRLIVGGACGCFTSRPCSPLASGCRPGRAPCPHVSFHPLLLQPHPSFQATALPLLATGVVFVFFFLSTSGMGVPQPWAPLDLEGDLLMQNHPLPPLAFPGSVREVGVVATQVSGVEEELPLVWAGASGRQVSPGAGTCFFLFFVFEGAIRYFTCCRFLFSLRFFSQCVHLLCCQF